MGLGSLHRKTSHSTSYSQIDLALVALGRAHL